MLPWNYDAAVAPPQISSVVNAADGTQPVAPGGLISVYGQQMSPVNMATQEIPLPTALGESCLTVNGVAVPMLFVSSQQINGQLPFNVDGNATMTLHTPGGISDNFNFTIYAAAPSIFRSGTAGPETGLATIVRADNNQLVTPTNPDPSQRHDHHLRHRPGPHPAARGCRPAGAVRPAWPARSSCRRSLSAERRSTSRTRAWFRARWESTRSMQPFRPKFRKA